MSELKDLRVVHSAVPKQDAFGNMTGAAAYTEDMVPPDALVVKLCRSPHAHARILSVDKTAALKTPGVVCVLTHKDVPHHRVSFAGASYPGNNPFDRVILDDTVRYVGDPVAIVAAETEEAAEKALGRLRVKYEVLDPVLDFEKAENAASIIHNEDDYANPMDIGGDPKHNLLMSECHEDGDFEAVYAACPVRLDETYYTSATQQAMMETYRTYSYKDPSGRLTLVSSTQVPFHARRITAMALGIPLSRVRVIKPRIGGGFGAKQTYVSEIFPAVVTWLTGKPAYCCFTRREAFACATTRHAMRIRVRLGAETDGTVRALWVDSLENAGAYGEHSVNVVGLSGHKTIPLYAKAAAWRYTGRAVYTNTTPGGAFRGFGATQGCFAVESTVNKLAAQLRLDPAELRLRNLPAVGDRMPAYFNEPLNSCTLGRCIRTGCDMLNWTEKYAPAPFARPVGPHRYRGAGMAVTMQGSGISGIDNASANIRLEDDAFYTLSIGATDMGTGCDTILAQMAAEVLRCSAEKIVTTGVDTQYSPYDPGSYASATTYVTGNAVVLAAKDLLGKMYTIAGKTLGVSAEELTFDGERFCAGGNTLTLSDMSFENYLGHNTRLTGEGTFCSPISPPPFVAGFAEVEVDTETGEITLCDFVAVADCGTLVNKNLARVQLEGGIAQGIGMALTEDPQTAASGRLATNSFLQYKIPSRLDLPEIRTAFEESWEPTGPFGAKSIGEVVVNTPSPAILSAIRNAVGVELHDLPATAEKVCMALRKYTHKKNGLL